MGPGDAVGAVERTQQAMGGDALSAMRFLAACGWCFGAVMLAIAFWAVRGRIADGDRSRDVAAKLGTAAHGFAEIVSKQQEEKPRRMRAPRSNPGLKPPTEGT